MIVWIPHTLDFFRYWHRSVGWFSVIMHDSLVALKHSTRSPLFWIWVLLLELFVPSIPLPELSVCHLQAMTFQTFFFGCSFSSFSSSFWACFVSLSLCRVSPLTEEFVDAFPNVSLSAVLCNFSLPRLLGQHQPPACLAERKVRVCQHVCMYLHVCVCASKIGWWSTQCWFVLLLNVLFSFNQAYCHAQNIHKTQQKKGLILKMLQ